ncbi:murein L,D-transpeptidase catalytic domain family protein [Sphingomicrobium sediminis]|uniref:Murein L,D-transpeptidase catalytic domain family protein n=1 Tax=Sphingomicrobium sediminis TaxID=2950949 RepID=A0A9X2EHU6_9SPHN|nr:murein L,D-transpeptidase catalytic domain family protein [Sphingomicrobium sediminis]MCM8558303.1 murein L,D-transpeptidase catalytic domain family protein [Sphingomicrobium sediminis]
MAGFGSLMLPAAAHAAATDPKSITPNSRSDVRFRPYAGGDAVDPALVARAREALDRHSSRIANRDRIGIVDYSKRSNLKRFHVLDMNSGQTTSHLVSHGRGSDRNHNGYLDNFSNRVGSLASSSGAYVTANRYTGKYGPSMRLHGLDWSNSNAFQRAIVMHPAWYAEADMVAKHGKLGRSEGCFAFGKRDHWTVMNLLGDGRLIYADKLA